ncbi:MAG: phosphopentomutase [Firmicutes bacterium HGW-Firmicutes-1]|jgi:phosphopentomutase|nr:MAG: phosphopentomutase [Firmicutes bacterium HGW-Firmicutes-1]
MIDRVIWIILDSVGIGELPDADQFGDVGSNTLENIAKATKLDLPNLYKLGLGNIDGVVHLGRVDKPIGIYGKMAEISNGKDTTIGHWEMSGVYSPHPLPTYPNGFPDEIITPFIEQTGREILANKPASGTQILEELGEEHMKTGKLIVYTSADSVFQIAAHEDVVPIDELYKYCSIARELLKNEHAVARVIARPFIGEPGSFKRTSNRRDYSLLPPNKTILDLVKESGKDVIAVGKIEDIFCGQGITEAVHTKDNMDGVDQTIQYMKQNNSGLIFTNLVEFDSSWGHRNDVQAYANGLMAFDKRLNEIMDEMKDSDILIMNADHGCDPTTESTDHSREYIPFIAFGNELKKGVNIGIRKSFADIGQTISEIFDLPKLPVGESFYLDIKKD